MKIPHTPGPWRVAKSSNPGNGSNWQDIVADTTAYKMVYVGEAQDKDAALIAAAPDMYAALIAVLNVPDYDGPEAVAALKAAQAAVRKAVTGKGE